MQQIAEHIKLILSTLPEKPGIYQYFDKQGTIIYVGKAKNLKRRVNSYFHHDHQSIKTDALVRNIADIHYTVVNNEQEAFLLENNLIKQYQPRYNILLKDGKSYPYICITKEPYPRVFKTRNVVKGRGEYYGPYTFGYTLDTVLELIHELYPIRTCNLPLTRDGIEKNKYKKCLKYHIKTCSGVCENLVSTEQYQADISDIRKIIKGDAHEISQHLYRQMEQYAAALQFEQAAEVKKKYDLIEKFRTKSVIANLRVKETDVFGYEETDENAYISILKIHNGQIIQSYTVEYKKQIEEQKEDILSIGILDLQEKIGSQTTDIIVPFLPNDAPMEWTLTIPKKGDALKVLELAQMNVKQYKLDKQKQSDKLNPDQRATRILGKLQDLLHLESIPYTIECFDNSNIQGTDAVAGCVVYKKGKPSKKDYRKYIIKTVEGADDYASMREIVYRRYSRMVEEQSELPDLIIADGGIGQMHAIRDIVVDMLHLSIPIAGLQKDDRHRTASLLYGFPPAEIGMKPTDELFLLLTQIQDEVHRYAITFHRQKRSKHQTESELDTIAGIGEKTKVALLKAFKSLKRIQNAEQGEIEKIVGKYKASIIYNHFHPKITA